MKCGVQTDVRTILTPDALDEQQWLNGTSAQLLADMLGDTIILASPDSVLVCVPDAAEKEKLEADESVWQDGSSAKRGGTSFIKNFFGPRIQSPDAVVQRTHILLQVLDAGGAEHFITAVRRERTPVLAKLFDSIPTVEEYTRVETDRMIGIDWPLLEVNS